MSKDGEEPTKCFYKFEDMAELLDRTSLGLRKKQITSGLRYQKTADFIFKSAVFCFECIFSEYNNGKNIKIT